MSERNQIPSHSPTIYAYLKTLKVGDNFTVVDLKNFLPADVSYGAISGFLYTCAKYGMVKRTGFRATGTTGRARLVYEMVDPLTAIPTRRYASLGGSRGRKAPHDGVIHEPRLDKVPAPLPTPQSLSERLLQIAAEVETMVPGLENVPTDALLAELKRRTVPYQKFMHQDANDDENL